jgi:excinuclease UvrABC nuclease subunit
VKRDMTEQEWREYRLNFLNDFKSNLEKIRLEKADLKKRKASEKLFYEKESNKVGIYLLYTVTKELIYVGKSVRLESRIFGSIDNKSIELNEKISYFKYGLVRNKPELGIYEAYYISKFKPRGNHEGIYDGELELILPELEFSDYIDVNSFNYICKDQNKRIKILEELT